MVKVILPFIVVIMFALPLFKKANSGAAADKITAAQFKNLMRTVAAGWNEGDARAAIRSAYGFILRRGATVELRPAF